MIRTTTERPFRRFVTLTEVPSGSMRCAATMAYSLKGSPHGHWAALFAISIPTRHAVLHARTRLVNPSFRVRRTISRKARD